MLQSKSLICCTDRRTQPSMTSPDTHTHTHPSVLPWQTEDSHTVISYSHICDSQHSAGRTTDVCGIVYTFWDISVSSACFETGFHESQFNVCCGVTFSCLYHFLTAHKNSVSKTQKTQNFDFYRPFWLKVKTVTKLSKKRQWFDSQFWATKSEISQLKRKKLKHFINVKQNFSLKVRTIG